MLFPLGSGYQPGVLGQVLPNVRDVMFRTSALRDTLLIAVRHLVYIGFGYRLIPLLLVSLAPLAVTVLPCRHSMALPSFRLHNVVHAFASFFLRLVGTGCCSGRDALPQNLSCILAGKLCRGLGGVPSRTSQPGRHFRSARCRSVQALGSKGGRLEATRRHCHTRSVFRQGPRRCYSTPFSGGPGTVVCKH